jgi:trk system potassium uptake protein TrkA
MPAAVTDSDEVNLISAVTAKELGATLTAARVYNQAYHGGEKVEYRNLLGIDLIISPQALAAFEIAKLIENPAAVMVETFAQGKVQMREMVVRHDSAAAGRRIRDLFPPGRREGAWPCRSREGTVSPYRGRMTTSRTGIR